MPEPPVNEGVPVPKRASAPAPTLELPSHGLIQLYPIVRRDVEPSGTHAVRRVPSSAPMTA